MHQCLTREVETPSQVTHNHSTNTEPRKPVNINSSLMRYYLMPSDNYMCHLHFAKLPK